jgi:beta-galactosidase/beta-glucuronidase
VPYELVVHRPDDQSLTAVAKGNTNQPFVFILEDPELWSPDTPNLYNVTVKLGDDTVTTYMGFRTVSQGIVDDIPRPLLNGEFIFQFSTLDQGYWPDGIYTPPSLEAMVWDLKLLKDTGFNMVRKHVRWVIALGQHTY